MPALLWGAWAQDWQQEHKVVFDGATKTIRVHAHVPQIAVKEDLYSAWKEWVQLRDNAKFLPALRVIGGDPVGGGQFAGDLYFVMNGWRVVVDHPVQVIGTLYNDESGSPYVILPGGGVTATVSSLAYAVTTEVPTPTQIAEAVHHRAVEGGVDLAGALRLVLATLVGKAAGAEGTTITFRGLLDDKDRVVATVDPHGNRTHIVYDPA